MKTQHYGVEIELTGITREQAVKVIAAYYNTNETVSYIGGTYSAWQVKDNQGRTWKAMTDSSIMTERRNGMTAGRDYSCEVVTPILGWDDIEDLQEIVRQLRHKGAIANSSCGIHYG